MNTFPFAHRFKSWLGFSAFLLVSVGVLFSIPQYESSTLVKLLMLANIYAVYAMGWDILSGYTGQISFGHSLFIGLGAYTSGLLTLYWGVPLWAAMLSGGFIAMLGGVILAFPALRLHGPYFSLITLVAPLIANRIVQIFSEATGGEYGLQCKFDLNTLTSKCVANANEVLGLNLNESYYASLGVVVVVLVGLFLLSRSRIGKIFEAIREDELSAESAGINTAKYKTLAFAISAFIVGMAGTFQAHFFFNGYVPRSMLGLNTSIEILLAAVLGGMGTIIGPFLGAYLLIVGRDSLGFLGEWRMLVFAVVALVILFILPRGTMTELKVFFAKHLGKRKLISTKP